MLTAHVMHTYSVVYVSSRTGGCGARAPSAPSALLVDATLQRAYPCLSSALTTTHCAPPALVTTSTNPPHALPSLECRKTAQSGPLASLPRSALGSHSARQSRRRPTAEMSRGAFAPREPRFTCGHVQSSRTARTGSAADWACAQSVECIPTLRGRNECSERSG